jgi:hypothetical protein
MPKSFSVEEVLKADQAGTINALRFITKNLVGIFAHEQRSADWYMPYMSLALPHPIAVEAGDPLRIRFQYDAGASVESPAIVDSGISGLSGSRELELSLHASAREARYFTIRITSTKMPFL